MLKKYSLKVSRFYAKYLKNNNQVTNILKFVEIPNYFDISFSNGYKLFSTNWKTFFFFEWLQILYS